MIRNFSHNTIRAKVFQRFLSGDIRVLGIESSCDDTSAAVVDSSRSILGESHLSQHKFHLLTGGIIPQVACNLHNKYIKNVVEESLNKSQLEFKDLDAIAVTVKPGLILSLIAGFTYAKDLCILHRKPMIPIHHMEAHALTARLTENVKLPFLVFLLSGGHCILAVVKSVDKFLKLGEAKTCCPGEVMDKLARRAKLVNIKKFRSLPGGAAIEAAALDGDPNAISFAPHILRDKNCNFSFSGIGGTAISYIQRQENKLSLQPDEVIPNINDFCASFQWALTRHLCQRLQIAIHYVEKKQLLGENEKCLVVSGGVASNMFIRNALKFVCDHFNYRMVVPPPRLCTDNGVMIAWNGIERLRENLPVVYPDDLDKVSPQAKCPLGEDISKDVVEVIKETKFSFIKLKYIIKPQKIREKVESGSL